MGNSPRKDGPLKRLYRAIRPDWIFAALLLFLIALPVREALSGDTEGALRFAILVPSFVVLACIAFFIARHEQSLSEDYFFRVIAQSAVIAIAATMLAMVAYEALAPRGDVLGGREVLYFLLGSWAIGYFLSRFRGPDA